MKANGLCYSPDESRLCISDSGKSQDSDGLGTSEFSRCLKGRKPRGGQVFADMSPGSVDGLRTDFDGYLLSSAAGAGPKSEGVHSLTPEGELIGRIAL